MWLGLLNRMVDNSDSIVDFSLIWIPTTRLYRRLRFPYNFDLFSIKVDWFRCNFDLKIEQSWLKDQKSQLKDWKYQFKNWNYLFISKSQFILTFSITFNIFLLKSIDFELFNLFWDAGIDFIATIRFRTTNYDRKSWLNPIWSQFKSKFKPRSIRLHKLR